jgi:hypothetical protein
VTQAPPKLRHLRPAGGAEFSGIRAQFAGTPIVRQHPDPVTPTSFRMA